MYILLISPLSLNKPFLTRLKHPTTWCKITLVDSKSLSFSKNVKPQIMLTYSDSQVLNRETVTSISILDQT